MLWRYHFSVKYKETQEKLLQLYLVKQNLVRSKHIS
jgi:hypothetical protein